MDWTNWQSMTLEEFIAHMEKRVAEEEAYLRDNDLEGLEARRNEESM